jgi:hypothetical protein
LVPCDHRRSSKPPAQALFGSVNGSTLNIYQSPRAAAEIRNQPIWGSSAACKAAEATSGLLMLTATTAGSLDDDGWMVGDQGWRPGPVPAAPPAVRLQPPWYAPLTLIVETITGAWAGGSRVDDGNETRRSRRG